MILMILLLIALFHLFLYYWNINPLKPKPDDLSETKSILVNHLNELKQYDNTI
jgi:hypothetical protein